MRLIELGLAGVWFSSVSAFTVSATFIPADGFWEAACPLGSNKKAGGGGKFSKLPMEDVLVIEEVLLIGGGGFWF